MPDVPHLHILPCELITWFPLDPCFSPNFYELYKRCADQPKMHRGRTLYKSGCFVRDKERTGNTAGPNHGRYGRIKRRILSAVFSPPYSGWTSAMNTSKAVTLIFGGHVSLRRSALLKSILRLDLRNCFTRVRSSSSGWSE